MPLKPGRNWTECWLVCARGTPSTSIKLDRRGTLLDMLSELEFKDVCIFLLTDGKNSFGNGPTLA